MRWTRKSLADSSGRGFLRDFCVLANIGTTTQFYSRRHSASRTSGACILCPSCDEGGAKRWHLGRTCRVELAASQPVIGVYNCEPHAEIVDGALWPRRFRSNGSQPFTGHKAAGGAYIGRGREGSPSYRPLSRMGPLGSVWK